MISKIRLQQYRSYLDQEFELSKGVNIVVGPNASGKTNLLEAIMVVCTGRSYRASDKDLIMGGKDWARIDATHEKGTRTIKINCQFSPSKELIVDNKIHKRISLNHQLPVVLFEPNDLLMLSGSPELRRRYLDGILEQSVPGYQKTSNDYLKTLRQRNALLKSGQADNNNIFPWNLWLSQTGNKITTRRVELIEILNKSITESYRRLSKGKEIITLEYKPSVPLIEYGSLLMKKLEHNFNEDVIRGFTTSGPHREDVIIRINNKQPGLYASRGESRSISVALKITEAHYLATKTNTQPIILLDDVFSELDTLRQQTIVRSLKNTQVIITTTDTHTHKPHQAKDINLIKTKL